MAAAAALCQGEGLRLRLRALTLQNGTRAVTRRSAVPPATCQGKEDGIEPA